MFCCTLLYVHSSIAIILMGKRELIALLNLSSWCLVMVERLFLAMPRGCLQFVIVVFPDHTHLLFFKTLICMTLQRSCLKFYIVSYPPLLQTNNNNGLRVYLYHDLYIMTLNSFDAFTVTVTPQSVCGSVISSKNRNYKAKKMICPGLYPKHFHQEEILVTFDLRWIKDWTS